MAKLRVAVFGCGRMGTLRVRSAVKWGAHVCAVFDTDADRSRSLAAGLVACRSNIVPSRSDWAEFDAVFVCTPPSEREPVRAALEYSIPTFLEKPIGLSASEGVDLVRLAGRNKVLTAVGFMNRYRASVRLVRHQLQGQTVLGASANWVNSIYKVPWWTRPELSGGSLNEQASHFVDLVRFVIGEPTSVFAISSPHPGYPELVGNAVITLSLPDGVLASISYSCRAEFKAIGFRVFTAEQEICLDGWGLDLTEGGNRVPVTEAATDRYEIFDIETRAFLDAVVRQNAETILCDLADGLGTQRVLDAVTRALAEGRPQYL